MDSIFGIGLGGIRTGLQRVASAASRLSNAFSPQAESNPVADIAELKAGERQVQASAAVVKTGDEITKATLDIIA